MVVHNLVCESPPSAKKGKYKNQDQQLVNDREKVPIGWKQ